MPTGGMARNEGYWITSSIYKEIYTLRNIGDSSGILKKNTTSTFPRLGSGVRIASPAPKMIYKSII
jgi:hypothetical protein